MCGKMWGLSIKLVTSLASFWASSTDLRRIQTPQFIRGFRGDETIATAAEFKFELRFLPQLVFWQSLPKDTKALIAESMAELFGPRSGTA